MKKPLFSLRNVSYYYDDENNKAVDSLDLDIFEGEFVAVLGHNGSGKSTLAKLLNGLFLPSAGTVTVDGMDTQDQNHTWDIRKKAGMVFQNPDNQIVATVVRDDVAFGLENIGVPTEEMPERIDKALEAVHMSEFIDKAPHMLSGGQKQRVAIAGILAMQPKALILDESTAMLDPQGRKEVLEAVKFLNKNRGITVIWITHFMLEAAQADRIVVISEGKLSLDGTPKEVFSHAETLRQLGLDVPPMAGLAEKLKLRGIALPDGILTVAEMKEEVLKLCR
ncbi:MAG: energy-coupling factor transporter ATPase [Eubacteriales bacterium]|nr:energy-coupling factor transporter ATPase [Eubacteriales bacterium]